MIHAGHSPPAGGLACRSVRGCTGPAGRDAGLYEVVRDNLETLYGAIGDGAIAVRIPKLARKELEAYLDCGLLAGALPA